MATKKKSTKKISKKKSTKKTSKKKITKKVSNKKASKKKPGSKKKSVSQASKDDPFNPVASDSDQSPAAWSKSTDDSPEEESKSTMGRIGVIAVLITLVVIFAIMQKNDMFNSKNEDSQKSEQLDATMQDSSSEEETTTEPVEEEKTDEAKPATQETSATDYTVKPGDSLYNITKKTMGAANKQNIELIKKENGLTGNSLKVGQVLKIPSN